MARLSLAAVAAALTPLVASQAGTPSALPDVAGPSGSACGGCYVVADVAGVLFGSLATRTQTNVVVTGNGTQVVSLVPTSVVEGQGKATFTDGNGPAGPGVVTSFMPVGSIVTVNGATLTSPTSYEVFTAYSVMSTVSGASGCSVSSGSAVTLSSAYKFPIPANAPTDYLVSLESQFIQSIGFPSCSAGGSNVQSTVHSQVTTTTTSVTSSAVPTAAPAAATTAVASATYNVPNVSLASAVPSVTPAANAADRPALTGVYSVAALIMALGALTVWM